MKNRIQSIIDIMTIITGVITECVFKLTYEFCSPTNDLVFVVKYGDHACFDSFLMLFLLNSI